MAEPSFRTLRLLIALIAALALTASCSSGPDDKSAGTATPATTAGAPSPTKTAAPLDLQQLLTKADVEAILGKQVAHPTTSNAGGTVFTCNYMAKDSSSLNMFARVSPDSAAARRLFEQAQAMSKNLSKTDPEPIAGLGDLAYWTGGDLNQLNVLKGRYWIIFSAPFAKEQAQELTQKAATLVMQRLP